MMDELFDIPAYTPENWFWVVAGNTRQAWSSKAAGFVKTWDKNKTTRIASLEELDGVLRKLGLVSPVVTAADVRSKSLQQIVETDGCKDVHEFLLKQVCILMKASNNYELQVKATKLENLI